MEITDSPGLRECNKWVRSILDKGSDASYIPTHLFAHVWVVDPGTQRGLFQVSSSLAYVQAALKDGHPGLSCENVDPRVMTTTSEASDARVASCRRSVQASTSETCCGAIAGIRAVESEYRRDAGPEPGRRRDRWQPRRD
jgi:hypothetical protein